MWSFLALSHMTPVSTSLLSEICQLSTSSTFNSGLLSHVVLSRNASRDILPFTLSIALINLVSLLSYSFGHFTILKALYPTGQPARLKKVLLTDPIKSFIEIAPGWYRLRRSPRRNLLLLDSIENELARNPGLVGGPYLYSTSPAPSRNPIPGSELVFVLISASVPTPISALALPSFDELFKEFMRGYLESNQGSRQPLAERKQFLKAKISEVYYNNSHIDCYHFYEQYEDHFETAGATGTNRTLFATFFFCGNISMRWMQYKRRHQGEKLTPITWTEFNAFLRKNLKESKSFVDSIWRKLKRNSQYQLEEVYN